jgi:2-(1,2-epoxy-1,2-dihydrophenyl)acetyl-CoA isomerase
LVNHVTAPKEALIFAKKLAEKIALQPKQSLAAIKAGVIKSLEITQEEAIQYNLELSDQVFKSPDCEEGIHAFFEKRTPRFE